MIPYDREIYESKPILFKNTLPKLIQQFDEESLFGFLLRLDLTNKFPTGTIIDMIKNLSTGKTSLNRPGLFLCGKIFDLEKLSKLVNLPLKDITDMTLTPTLKRFFRKETSYPDQIGYSTDFKICPLCIRENKMPLIHVLRNVTACLEHKIKLENNCICGYRISVFSSGAEPVCCPNCSYQYYKLEPQIFSPQNKGYNREVFYHYAYKSIIYKNTNLVHNNEDLSEGVEARLQFIACKRSITSGDFKVKFGFDASNMKNGHGLLNLSLARIVDILYILGFTPQEFRDINFNHNYKKFTVLHENTENSKESTCPNIYCAYYRRIGGGNISFYGRKRFPSGEIKVEEFCKTCGTRFFGSDIIQSYDYNPGVRKSVIEKARVRILKWQNELIKVCEEMIKNRVPITLTGCFKKASIPIGKTYFIDRLGLISVLEKYAHIQRYELMNHENDMNQEEISDFLRRIYKHRQFKNIELS